MCVPLRQGCVRTGYGLEIKFSNDALGYCRRLGVARRQWGLLTGSWPQVAACAHLPTYRRVQRRTTPIISTVD